MTHPLAEDAAGALERLRTTRPRVHCITNNAAQALTANGLLALGALPSLTVNPDEIADFSASADALLVNLGTLDRDRRAAIDTALEIFEEDRRPFVLDPVFVDVSATRCAYARKLVEREPEIIRLNGAELAALAGTDDVDPSQRALEWLTVMAVTGDADRVTDGSLSVRLDNGNAIMDRVTAMGCLSSAIVAAFLPVTQSPISAAVAGLGVMGLAGEMAAAKASGPGSFAVHFLDVLSGLTPPIVASRLRVEADET